MRSITAVGLKISHSISSLTARSTQSRQHEDPASNKSTKPSTRKSSTYDPAFEQRLIDRGIYSEGHDDEGSGEPNNLEGIMDKL